MVAYLIQRSRKSAFVAFGALLFGGVMSTPCAGASYDTCIDCGDYYYSCSTYSAYVAFDAAGGTGTMSRQTLKLSDCSYSMYVVPACSFKRKGYRFAGWRRDCCCMYDDRRYYPGDEIYDLEDCLPYSGSTMWFIACWEPASSVEYDYLYVDLATDCVRMDVGDWVYEDMFYIESGSDWTMTVSGLPAGLRYDAKTRAIDGYTTKRGIYYSVFTAKNDNGYKHTAILKWNVGDAVENEYDHIGNVFEDIALAEEDYGFYAGSYTYIMFDASLKSVSGLPPGLKFVKGSQALSPCEAGYSDSIEGVPTKAGKYTLTFVDRYGSKAVKNIIVRDPGCQYVSVEPYNGQSYRGTVTKSGVYEAGKKVSISASAKSGYYFAGWYYDPYGDAPCYIGDSGDYRTARDSFVMGPDIMTDGIYARFVSKSEDSHISIDCDSEWNVCTECGEDWFWIDVYSESKPTLTAKGLPTGVKLTKWGELQIADMTKLKPGTSEVTLTAKNLSGAVATRKILIRVPNLRSWVFGISDEIYEGALRARVGVSDACFVPPNFTVADGWKVTASGLPSGLRFSFEQGLCASRGVISGTPTKAGVYTVTFTAKRGTETQKATVTYIVDSLPDYVVGKFNGLLQNDNGNIGTFALTATAAGRLSVTMVMNDGTRKTYSASSWNCEYDGVYSGYLVKPSASTSCSGSEVVYFEVSPRFGWDDYQLNGYFEVDSCRYGGEGEIVAQRYPFGKIGNVYENAEAHSIAETLYGYGKMDAYVHERDYGEYDLACRTCFDFDPRIWTTPDLTFTVGLDGTVRVAGRIAGKSVSGSATLRVIGDMPQANFFFKVNGMPLDMRVDFWLGYGPNSAVTGWAKFNYGY